MTNGTMPRTTFEQSVEMESLLATSWQFSESGWRTRKRFRREDLRNRFNNLGGKGTPLKHGVTFSDHGTPAVVSQAHPEPA